MGDRGGQTEIPQAVSRPEYHREEVKVAAVDLLQAARQAKRILERVRVEYGVFYQMAEEDQILFTRVEDRLEASIKTTRMAIFG